MSIGKAEVVAALEELRQLVTLRERDPQAFRVRAYERAVHGLDAVGDEVARMSEAELCELPGVGKGIARKIRELVDTGSIAELEALRAEFPPELVRLSRIPGLGPKSIAKLRSELGIQSVEDLKAAIATKSLREVRGFGPKMEQQLGEAIERLGLDGKSRRTPIADAMKVARRVVEVLERLDAVERAVPCGSLRRLRETIGDIDIVAVAAPGDAPGVMDAFTAMSDVASVVVSGETKTSVLTHGGLQIDLRVVDAHQLGAALLYFTGSKTHNIKLRQRAQKRGWVLNEYALGDAESGDVIASATEEEIYAALELPFIPPPMREDSGEVEASEAGELPATLTLDDLRGDLHVHTSLSGDGRSSLDEILAAARARGYAYLAITDHGEDLAINGVSREGLLRQREQLAERSSDAMRLLHGVELNIGPSGSLDYDAEFRRGFDWCVAAVHSHFDLSREQQTRRILAAMDDPAVNVIGHLTGRRIGSRPGIDIDVDAVLRAAASTGTAIEINSALPRLDAAADVLRRARDYEVTLVVSTDAHHTSELDRAQWGAQQAQRGWVDRERVANTWPRERFLAWAAKRRSAGP